MQSLPSICFTFLLACSSLHVFATSVNDSGHEVNHASTVSADDVIRLDTAIEPMICELLDLENQLITEVSSSGVDAKDLMARDANDDSPVARNIRRITGRVQEIQTQIAPTTSKLDQMVKQLSAADRSIVDTRRRGIRGRCHRP